MTSLRVGPRRLALRFALAFLPLLAVSDCDDGDDSDGLPVGKIQHVFVILLENKGYETTFGAGSEAPYLANELAAQGQLLRQYHATAHVSLPNYIALVSGQAPTTDTQTDCHVFKNFVATGAADTDGQLPGSGCVYPTSVETVADQLEARGLTWRGYMEDMGNAAPAEPANCRHPAIDATDTTQDARVGDQYAARHNPFVYFHSIIDDQAGCDANVVPLTQLEADLASAATTPNYVFITPNLCNDAHDGGGSKTCVDGQPGGLVSADAWLRVWVPKILSSPAFKESGMLLVTLDEAEFDPSDPEFATACCAEAEAPNLESHPAGLVGPGGGRIGAVVLSPYVEPGTVNDAAYNHYSFLRTVEDLYEVPRLGYAGLRGLRAFGGDVFGRVP